MPGVKREANNWKHLAEIKISHQGLLVLIGIMMNSLYNIIVSALWLLMLTKSKIFDNNDQVTTKQYLQPTMFIKILNPSTSGDFENQNNNVLQWNHYQNFYFHQNQEALAIHFYFTYFLGKSLLVLGCYFLHLKCFWFRFTLK